MWPHHRPVTGPHLSCLQQEYADWDIPPPAIVPLLISSHWTFSIRAFHRSCWEDLQVDLKSVQKKGSSWYMWIRAAANDYCPGAQFENFKLTFLVRRNSENLKLNDDTKQRNVCSKSSHLRSWERQGFGSFAYILIFCCQIVFVFFKQINSFIW